MLTIRIVRFGLLVGIAGGAPNLKNDIRLGDIVVSAPTPQHGGVLQYDYGRTIQNQDFKEIGHLAAPPEIVLNALAYLSMQHKRKGHRLNATIQDMVARNSRLQQCHPSHTGPDVLYESLYVHKEKTCECDTDDEVSTAESHLISRKSRGTDLEGSVIHYGLIASGNQLMKDATIRDKLSNKYDVLCFEMEAAGLMNSFPCAVIRGICDYSDTHKKDSWQPYAAAVAAAYAKELLEVIAGEDSTAEDAGPFTAVQDNKPSNPFTETSTEVVEYNKSGNVVKRTISRTSTPPSYKAAKHHSRQASFGSIAETQSITWRDYLNEDFDEDFKALRTFVTEHLHVSSAAYLQHQGILRRLRQKVAALVTANQTQRQEIDDLQLELLDKKQTKKDSSWYHIFTRCCGQRKRARSEHSSRSASISDVRWSDF